MRNVYESRKRIDGCQWKAGDRMAVRTNLVVAPLDDCCPAVLSAPMSEPRAEELATAFGVLADPVRLRLLSLLASAEAGEACVCELVEPLARSQPTVSHHLKVLADAGLIVGEKRAAGSGTGLPRRLGHLSGALV